MNDATFVRDALALPQESAQRNRYAVGIWSQDQYEAYMHVWAETAFGFWADGWRKPTFYPEVARLIDLLHKELEGRKA